MNSKESIKIIAKAILQMMVWPTQCAIVVLRLDGRLSDWHVMLLILPFMIGMALMVVIGKITKDDESKLNHEMYEMSKKNIVYDSDDKDMTNAVKYLLCSMDEKQLEAVRKIARDEQIAIFNMVLEGAEADRDEDYEERFKKGISIVFYDEGEASVTCVSSGVKGRTRKDLSAALDSMLSEGALLNSLSELSIIEPVLRGHGLTIRQHGIVDVSADQMMTGDMVLISGKYRKVQVSSPAEGQVSLSYQYDGQRKTVRMNCEDVMSVERVTNLDGQS